MRLIEVLPDYYDDNKTMQEIQGNLSQESDNLEDGLANTLKEIYWTSATGKDCSQDMREYSELSLMQENQIVTGEKKFQQSGRGRDHIGGTDPEYRRKLYQCSGRDKRG